MSNDLRSRLDRFVIGLLDEVEACVEQPVSDTEVTASEEIPAPVSLTDRVAVCRIAIAWWNARSGKRGTEEPEEPAEIDGLVVELKRREKRGR